MHVHFMVVKTTFKLNVLHLCMQTNEEKNKYKHPHSTSALNTRIRNVAGKSIIIHHVAVIHIRRKKENIYIQKKTTYKKKNCCRTAFQQCTATNSIVKCGRILISHLSNFLYIPCSLSVFMFEIYSSCACLLFLPTSQQQSAHYPFLSRYCQNLLTQPFLE